MRTVFIFFCVAVLMLGFLATVQADPPPLSEERTDPDKPDQPTPVAEPLSLALLGGGLLGLYGLHKKFKQD